MNNSRYNNEKIIELKDRYHSTRSEIQQSLAQFKKVLPEEYFYELCFCICTPQSKARNAIQVVEILKNMNFMNYPSNPSEILRMPEHYIRFHNQKAKSLLDLQAKWSTVICELLLENTVENKRDWLVANIRGVGMKEAAHFLRNIGIVGVAILDRHILKRLLELNVIEEVITTMSKKQYLEIEADWIRFCDDVVIPMEEMDLLFWSMETGEILK